MRLIFFASFLVFAAPACALAQDGGTTTRTHWASFMRAGPGYNFGSLDEIDGDQTVRVFNCAEDWCAITHAGARGFIEQDALTLAELPKGREPTGGAQGCFESYDTGWLRPIRQTFCQTKP